MHIHATYACFRILVDSGGCSGFEYKLSIDQTVNSDDEVINQDGARVVIDQVGILSLH